MASKPARAEPTRHRRIRLVVVQQLIGHLLAPGGNSQFFSIPVLALAMRKGTWSLPATTLRGRLASQPTAQNKLWDFQDLGHDFRLALQLFFFFEVRALSGSLVSSTPE